MHLDIITKKCENQSSQCQFTSYLHEGRLKLVNRSRVRARYAKKYTQLFMMITPNNISELPEEIQKQISSFHKKISELDLKQDRDKTIRLVKFTVANLNSVVQKWNADHKRSKPIMLNLTIVFVYGDHLILLNFGNNMVYIYRDGDLTTFRGSRLDSDKHYSLKTGREGKMEYMLFDENVPPVGVVDFGTNQISALFKITHKLLKGDLLCVLSNESINQDKFRVNVNLFEQAIEKPQMLKLIEQSKNETVNGITWGLLAFDEVREFRQTVRYSLFRTPKGLMSFFLLLFTLALPIIYQQNLVIDDTPVSAFDTPPTTAHITLLSNEDTFTLDLIPNISGSPTEDVQIQTVSISQLLSNEIAQGVYPQLATYYPHRFDAPEEVLLETFNETAETLSIKYYGHNGYASLIGKLNPELLNNISRKQNVYFPVFSIPYDDKLKLEDISYQFYISTDNVEYLRQINNMDNNTIPFGKVILVPPLSIYPLPNNQ